MVKDRKIPDLFIFLSFYFSSVFTLIFALILFLVLILFQLFFYFVPYQSGTWSIFIFGNSIGFSDNIFTHLRDTVNFSISSENLETRHFSWGLINNRYHIHIIPSSFHFHHTFSPNRLKYKIFRVLIYFSLCVLFGKSCRGEKRRRGSKLNCDSQRPWR